MIYSHYNGFSLKEKACKGKKLSKNRKKVEKRA